MNDGTGPLALVTGATGFVGSHIAESLRDAGFRLRCSLRATSDPRWIEALDPERVTLDMESEGGAAQAIAGADVVVHAAGITRAPDPDAYQRVNVEGTARLARAAAAAGVRRFVFISSLAARGPDRARGPEGARPDQTPSNRPVSPYGASKLIAERRLREIVGSAEPEVAAAGMTVTALRPAGVYGPRDTDLLPLFRMAARGWLPVPGGESCLQPVFVDDVARAAVLAAGAPPTESFGPYPVAGPDRCTWEEIADALAAALGRRVRLFSISPRLFMAAGAAAEVAAGWFGRDPVFDRRRTADLAHYRWTTSTAATEQALDWSPAVGVREGLARTADWYREVGWLRR